MTLPEYATLAARNEAREAVRGPGKFECEHPMTYILHSIMLNWLTDEFVTCAAERIGLDRTGCWSSC